MLEIDGNGLLSSMHLPILEHAWGGLIIQSNPALNTFSLPSLVQGNYHLGIGWNANLTSFDIPLVEHVWQLAILNNPSLTSFSLPSLASWTNYLWIFGNTSLAQCLVDELLDQIQAAGGTGSEPSTHDNNEACTCEEVEGETVATCP